MAQATKKKAPAPKSYLTRTLNNIAAQCESRGIEDVGKVFAALKKEHGKDVSDMTGDGGEHQLKRVNQRLDASLRTFLEGRKRAWEE